MMSAPNEGTPLVKAQVYGETGKGLGTTVEVMAPSDLAAGYQFYVDASDIKYVLVTVPPGGVRAGQVFQAEVLEEHAGGGHKIPYGDWRDSICNCFAFGCCHPQCCLTFWFPACALGQILSRLKLDWRAKETNGPPRSPFVIWFSLVTAYIIVTTCLSTIIDVFGGERATEVSLEDILNGSEPVDFEEAKDDPRWVTGLNVALDLINLVFVLLVLVIMIRARGFIRKKYRIPERRCRGCEDCCCSFWCSPCSICQMARHTGNYRDYPAACCSETGFAAAAPRVV